MSLSEELEKLVRLRDKGLLTLQEFENAKKSLLNDEGLVRSNKADLIKTQTFTTQKEESLPRDSPVSYTSRTEISNANDNNTKNNGLVIAVGAMFFGLFLLVFAMVFAIYSSQQPRSSNNNRNSINTASQSIYDYLPLQPGKGLFKSGSTGKVELINVTIRPSRSHNGHLTYKASWGDGVNSTYIFWPNKRVKIISEGHSGKTFATPASYSISSNKDCIITAETGAITVLGKFSPSINF